MIGLITVLFVAIVALSVAWRKFNKVADGFLGVESVKPAPKATNLVQSDTPVAHVEQQPTTAPVVSVAAEPEIVASPLVVKHLNQGRATLILRYRARKKACTAHLIIWSGAKRRRIQDSYYDLGIIARERVDGWVVDEFMALAQAKLIELQNAARKTRKVKVADVEPVVATVQQEALQNVEAPEPEVVSSASPETKLKKFPSVYRGIITEIGMMTQNKNGADFNIFGVRYRTLEGLEDAVFGANLRIALQDAKAGVGDSVEILKIGRKTVEEGRAPMNLFTVAKIASA